MSADPPHRSRSPSDGPGRSRTSRARPHTRAHGRLAATLACLLTLGAGEALGATDTDSAEAADARAAAASSAAPAESGPELEHGIKAAFLLNFVRYTTWPKESFESADSPLRVLVVGRDPFGKLLDDTLRGEKAHGRPFDVDRSAEVPEEIRAHVVFCGELSRAERQRLLERCRKRPVLLVGEASGFAQEGACINFYLHEKKVRFEVNVDAVAEAKLQISASVLKLARIVKYREEDER